MKLPLAGIRVVEFEGIGPGPLAGRMLADMGAEVTVIARPRQRRRERTARWQPARTRCVSARRVVPLDLKQSAAVAEALTLVAAGRRVDRRQPPRRDGAAGPRARRTAPRATRRLVYGRMTGWGQSRAAGPGGGARPELCRADRVCCRCRRTAASGRSCRRRWSATPPVRWAWPSASPARLLDARTSGRGRVVDARHRRRGGDARWHRADGARQRTARRRLSRARSTTRRSTTSMPAPTVASSRSAHWSRSSTRCCWTSSAWPTSTRPRQYDKAAWPLLKARFAALFRQPAARALVRPARRQRRLLRAGAEHRRGRGASAQRGTRDLQHRWRRRRARGGRAAFRGAGMNTIGRARRGAAVGCRWLTVSPYQPTPNRSASITPVPHTIVPNRLRFHA